MPLFTPFGLGIRIGDRRGQEQPLGVGMLRRAGHSVTVAELDNLVVVYDREEYLDQFEQAGISLTA